MNMKKKMKAFFTMNRHANEGFTLVELIVVIAILAILAGVAVPAYSGYIEKAERAADDQLLGTLNTAFAAACAFNGESNYGRSDNPSITINAGAVASNALNTANDAIDLSFAEFFEGGTFKSVTGLVYMPGSGAFVRGGTMTFSFGGQQITLNVSDVAILSGDNAFSDRGSEALLGDIGTLETYLETTQVGKGILDQVKLSPEYIRAVGGYMGLTQKEGEDYKTYVGRVEEALEGYGDSMDTVMNNALIMYSASNAAGTTEDDITTLFTYNEKQGLTGRIEMTNADGTRDNAATMANAALAYGMYTAYLERNKLDATDTENDFVVIVNTKEFADYVAGDQGQADLEAYMAAMNMISDNVNNTEITSSILTNGITGNTALEQLMKEVMGK